MGRQAGRQASKYKLSIVTSIKISTSDGSNGDVNIGDTVIFDTTKDQFNGWAENAQA